LKQCGGTLLTYEEKVDPQESVQRGLSFDISKACLNDHHFFLILKLFDFKAMHPTYKLLLCDCPIQIFIKPH
jgi:hypothetical protein